jgi:molybdopterin molybdotransferase
MTILEGKPVFCLPGGPPSNEMAFLMIVLPALLRMAGHTTLAYPELFGRLDWELTGQVDWTQFVHCDVSRHDRELRLTPLDMSRRLSAISRTRGIVKIPEGVELLEAHTLVPFTPVAMD